MPSLSDIALLFTSGQRNHIVFSREQIAGLKYIDIGRELANMIQKVDSDDGIIDPESMYQQIFSQTQLDATIGKYLAIDNIGILFEPSLHYNLKIIFDNYSINNWLIIRTDALIQDNKLYFLDLHSSFVIDLYPLNYKIA